MVRLKLWQWLVLSLPIATIIGFLMVAAGMQMHQWGINWIWGVFTLVFVAWRWLLVRWTQPAVAQLEAAIAEVSKELESTTNDTDTILPAGTDATKRATTALQEILIAAQSDRPIWEDWQTFWQRCTSVVGAIANIYHPEVKYPLLNIYIPQAYGLIRGTVDDLDRWMQKLSPALNQVTVGQAYQSYEVYRKIEPSARKFIQAWNWAQWLLNPVVAVAKRTTQRYSTEANQQLLGNFSQLLREAALRNLCSNAIALYGGTIPATFTPSTPTLKAQTQTLQEILAQASPAEVVVQKPVNILIVGRTGAGKSSLINTLFRAELAAVDVLPSTEELQYYHWESQTGETLTLWDTPGYEQVNRPELREQVLDYASRADLLLLVTPALDPALQMDVDFIKSIKSNLELPTIGIVTKVDKLRPLREWQPPYDWESGDRPKEISIREATEYRAQQIGDFCDYVLPVVTGESKTGRNEWNVDVLSLFLVEAIAPAVQLRLARFLRDLEVRSVAAAKIIDRYTFQMATTQGLTALLKSPVLQFISTLSTGSPNLAYVLAQKIPVEQLPLVIGKLQMAYELYTLLSSDDNAGFDLLKLWPLLLDNSDNPDRNAKALGYALVEYWTGNLTVEKLRERFDYYLMRSP